MSKIQDKILTPKELKAKLQSLENPDYEAALTVIASHIEGAKDYESVHISIPFHLNKHSVLAALEFCSKKGWSLRSHTGNISGNVVIYELYPTPEPPFYCWD